MNHVFVVLFLGALCLLKPATSESKCLALEASSTECVGTPADTCTDPGCAAITPEGTCTANTACEWTSGVCIDDCKNAADASACTTNECELTPDECTDECVALDETACTSDGGCTWTTVCASSTPCDDSSQIDCDGGAKCSWTDFICEQPADGDCSDNAENDCETAKECAWDDTGSCSDKVETGDCTDQHTEADCCTRDCVWVDCEVDCSGGKDLATCCDIDGCSWIKCDGATYTCEDSSKDCGANEEESCPEENGGDILKVTVSTLMLSLMSVKLLF